MHIVNDIHRIDIKAGEPFHILVQSFLYRTVIESIALNYRHLRPYVQAAGIIYTAVQRQQQQLGEITARAEELHLLTYLHCRNTAGYRVIVAVYRAHKVIVLILNRIRIL